MPTPAPLRLRPTKAFERDLKRQKKRGKDLGKLREVLDRLGRRLGLEAKHRDHALTGDRRGWRDCHVEPDWLMIYRVDEAAGELLLGRTGTHSDVF